MHCKNSKADVLCKMIKILHDADPMGLRSTDEDEYDSEALSILARFNESGFQLAEYEEAIPIATAMVRDVFEFWFSGLPPDSVWQEQVARLLLTAYLDEHPKKRLVEHIEIG